MFTKFTGPGQQFLTELSKSRAHQGIKNDAKIPSAKTKGRPKAAAVTRDFFSTDGNVIKKDEAIDSAVGYNSQYKTFKDQLRTELQECKHCTDKYCKIDKQGLHRTVNAEMICAWVEALVSNYYLLLDSH